MRCKRGGRKYGFRIDLSSLRSKQSTLSQDKHSTWEKDHGLQISLRWRSLQRNFNFSFNKTPRPQFSSYPLKKDEIKKFITMNTKITQIKHTISFQSKMKPLTHATRLDFHGQGCGKGRGLQLPPKQGLKSDDQGNPCSGDDLERVSMHAVKLKLSGVFKYQSGTCCQKC